MPESAPAIETRPIRLHMRPDLQVVCHRHGRGQYWVVKDPVALRYHRLLDEEYFLLRSLDGQTALSDLCDQFQQRHAPQRITVQQLQTFLARLHESGLVRADHPGQSAALMERRRRRSASGYRQLAGNLLAIRLPGISPEPALSWLYARLSWGFSRWLLAACGLVSLAALLTIVLHFEEFTGRLLRSREFVQAEFIPWFVAAVVVAKLLHELGHALVCRHVGGRCHEVGVMLLALVPCLYCNVSDVWMVADRRKRIAVSAAGMGVELVLAACCCLVWWHTQPGFSQQLAFSLMVTCSVGTLFINANPLMRFDGYFILSDLMATPNLASESRRVVRQTLARWLFGMTWFNERTLPADRRAWLFAYGVASTVYRWVLIVGILWMCHILLGSELSSLAWLLTFSVGGGMLMNVMTDFWQSVRTPGLASRISRPRLAITSAGLIVVLSVAAFCPLPRAVTAPASVRIAGGKNIFVTVPGTLAECVLPGQEVNARDVVARLEDDDLRIEVERLTSQRNEARLRLANLHLRRADDLSVGAQIPTARATLADLENRLADLTADLDELELRSPVTGKVVPYMVDRPDRSDEPTLPDLPGWSRTPFDPANLGCYLEAGTVLCQVGDASRCEAVALLPAADLNAIRAGQQAIVRLEEYPGTAIRGRVSMIAETAVRATSPADPLRYEVLIELRENGPLLSNSRGTATIEVSAESLLDRVRRWVGGTLRF